MHPSSSLRIRSETCAFAVALAGLLVAMAGCGGKPVSSTVSCASDAECKAGQVCREGTCQAIPTCATGCDDSNPCTADSCVEGACSHEALPETTTCDDKNPCTKADHCQAGACAGEAIANMEPCDGQAGFCGPTGCLECQLELHCTEKDGNPCTVPRCTQGGFCVELPGNEGGACSDGDLCTIEDHCVSGACATTPKDCSVPPSQCHAAGTCNAGTGNCDYPILGGTACNDGNWCTANDFCNADGACVGTNMPGWHRKVTIEYVQADPDGSWAAPQNQSFVVDGAYSSIRVHGASDDGGYCYAWWGSGHVERYRQSGSWGLYNVNGAYYSPMGGNCPTYPPTFDGVGNVAICQATSDWGNFQFGTGEVGLSLPVGTPIHVQGRHAIGSGNDWVNCYMDLYCP